MGECRIIHPTPDLVGLAIGDEVQGCYWVEPQAPQAGPYCYQSQYMGGWVAAGAHHPGGNFLMVGLGSGAGLCGLMLTHPDCLVTCCDTDPRVIHLAERAFPILQVLQGSGRLQICNAPAESLGGDWDVVLCDAYTGAPGYATDLSFLAGLVDRSRAVWVNCIGRPGEGQLGDVTRFLAGQGRLRAAYPVEPFRDHLANWILTDQPHSPEILFGTLPYPGAEHGNVDRTRAAYCELIRQNRLDLLVGPAQ